MTTPNNEDWERRLKELEVEVNPDPEQPNDLSKPFEKTLYQLKQWYGNLSTPAQVAVAIVGIVLVFSVLNSVLKLVASLLTITILAVVLYGLYKFLITPRPHQGD
ncbi:conserved hypothetical protein [Gloeothece citriformis PCC 7424]|uniref:Uncharacterized protein n=1 Tax=Gloeothece citriformis (strain PCC 7424) TaxID=65393 RepID=B7KKZ7_GLOC7|nr:hypothetical protein [Gloeothece citriformis]ACK72369.1 conserved hypothetical protein [Gloeothece citriformis PCC 7424]